MGNTLKPLAKYFIFSAEDAPERSFGSPEVHFRSISMHAPPNCRDCSAVVQVGMVKWELWNHIDCCTDDDVAALRCSRSGNVYIPERPSGSPESSGLYLHTLRLVNGTLPKTEDTKYRVIDTGMYILTLVNCGGAENAGVTGVVVVRNPHGFLPANEYQKLPFYGWLAILYLLLGMIWAFLSIRWANELFAIQNCISAVLCLGTLESCLWYVLFRDWNWTGRRMTFLFIISLVVAVIKQILSYMLVLVASLGLGVTRDNIDRPTSVRMQGVACLYIVLDIVREIVVSFDEKHALPWVFVLSCLLPVAALNGVLFYWVIMALTQLIETLKELRQFEKLQMFKRFFAVLAFSLLIASITLFREVMGAMEGTQIGWQYQWLYTDGIAHSIYTVVLVSVMYLWQPHHNSKRYAYSHQLDDQELDVRFTGPIEVEFDSWEDTPEEFETELEPVDVSRATMQGKSTMNEDC